VGIDAQELVKRYPKQTADRYATRWQRGQDPNQVSAPPAVLPTKCVKPVPESFANAPAEQKPFAARQKGSRTLPERKTAIGTLKLMSSQIGLFD
jgi:hypothetical protein